MKGLLDSLARWWLSRRRDATGRLTHQPLVLLCNASPGMYKVGDAYYQYPWHKGRYSFGFYRVAKVVRFDEPGDRHDMVYGESVFPVLVSDCHGSNIPSWINHPFQCGHDWHAGPKHDDEGRSWASGEEQASVGVAS